MVGVCLCGLCVCFFSFLVLSVLSGSGLPWLGAPACWSEGRWVKTLIFCFVSVLLVLFKHSSGLGARCRVCVHRTLPSGRVHDAPCVSSMVCLLSTCVGFP